MSKATPPNAPIRIVIHENWTFRQSGTDTLYPATVPGTVHTDLMANGIIEDPFYRTNERDLQWIDKEDWEYLTTFKVDEELLQNDRIRLRFDGLDTHADVFLNDTLILRADNFFVGWQADVKELLKEGKNHLRIYFHAPIKIGLQKLEANGYALPAVNDQSQNGGLGRKKVSVFLRKPGYHFGWDWGPRLVTSGIWRPVILEAWNEARIEDLFFLQEKVDTTKAEIRACLDIQAEQAFEGRLKIFQAEKKLLVKKKIHLKKGLNHLEIGFEIKKPRLWWTHELGKPHLYSLTGVLEKEGRELDRRKHQIGLRTIRLVQEPDKKGSSFYFELNGVPVFAKGANYIPNDVFLPRVRKKQYQNIIESAVAANMNMLRVWGGGIYENEAFYQLCDQHGILVWQDFMFACSMYPGDSLFVENVRKEAEYNVKRLRNHPSIALWCGNNEIDVAWSHYRFGSGWGWKEFYLPARRNKIWKDYEKIFHELLPQVVEQEAPDMFYWPSSPYKRPGEHANYHSTSGDIHYWGVWGDKHDFSGYDEHVGRFMSEYGFQSFPELQSVKRFTLPEDRKLNSEVMAAHQRSSAGNGRIRYYLKKYYRQPSKFSHNLYLSQLLQAEGIKTAIEAHRMNKPYCMGSLYWQINDCWPVASWSGIDYYHNWKAMHYFVKKAFAPVAIIAREKDGQFRLHISSDVLEDIPATLRLKAVNFKGKVLWETAEEIVVKANTSSIYLEMPAKEIIHGKNANKILLQMTLFSGDTLLHSGTHYFNKVKKLKLPAKPYIKVSMEKKGKQYLIRLKSNRLAKNIFLQFEKTEGFFSDNYFDLLPRREAEITFTPGGKAKDLTDKDLRILTVADAM